MIKRHNKKKDLGKEAKLFLLRRRGGEFIFKGNSMGSVIKEGYRIKVVPEAAYNLKRGNLIVYEKNDIVVCHRFLKKIKAKDRWYLLEKGDNNIFPTFVTENYLVGRVKDICYNNGDLLDLKVWKNTPLYSRFCSFFWFIFLIRWLIKRY